MPRGGAQRGEPDDDDARALAFGQLLRTHRTQRHLSQEELAARSGTSIRLISNLERGVAGIPRARTLTTLADALRVDAAERRQFLHGGQPEEPPGGRLAFGRLLRTLREGAGLTQEDLASRSLVSVRTVSDLERGVNRAPRRETALLMAESLGLVGANRDQFDAAVASAAEFVRLRTRRSGIGAGLGTVPVPAAPLLGREAELAALHAHLHDDGTMVATVVGPAGVGKTRLAIELATTLQQRDERRVLFLPLASTRTTADVLQVLALALDVSLDETVEAGGHYEDAGLDAIADSLRTQPSALVLDNLEQVDGGARLVTTLAGDARCPIVVTSRIALRITGERVIALRPLQLPDLVADIDDRDMLLGSPAVRFFLDRAHAAVPRWRPDTEEIGDVARLCHLLDGLPLALELAAPAVRTRSVRAVTEDIATRRDLLSSRPGNLPHRHRSLHAALAWSYSLLDAPARTVFARLSVFGAAVDVETADLVCGVDGLNVPAAVAALVDANLLIADQDAAGEPQLRMLNTIAQFAAERLAESADATEVAERHAAVMVQVAEATAPKLVGPDQGFWAAQLGRRVDSLRIAQAWLLDRGQVSLAARLAAALWRFWYLGGQLREGGTHLERVLREIDGGADCDAAAAAGVQYGLGVLTYMSGNVTEARWLWTRSRKAFEQHGDFEGTANSINNLGMTYLYAGDLPAARSHYEAAIETAERSGKDRPVAVTLGNIAKLLVEEGRGEQAPQIVDRALTLFRGLGDVRAEADLHGLLAEIAIRAGHRDEARSRWEQALRVFEQLGDPTGTAPILVALAELTLQSGGRAEVRPRIERALVIAEQANDPWTTANAWVVLAQLAVAEDDDTEALALLDRADALSTQCDHVEVQVRVRRLREQIASR